MDYFGSARREIPPRSKTPILSSSLLWGGNSAEMNSRRLIRGLSKTLAHQSSYSSSSRQFCSQPASTFAVKKVTKNNFDSSLEELTHHVRGADFVSIDLEMTGITSAPWRESFDFDRSDVRYLKVKDSVEKFAVVQFGICSFQWDSHKNSFIAHPYTFYVFPRKELPIDGPSYEFLCQTSSLDFLSKYQFDFNACIYQGISYLSRAQEVEALNRLNYEDEVSNLEHQSIEVTDIPTVGIADVLFTERMKNRFGEWCESLLRTTDGKSQFQGNTIDSKAQLHVVFFKMHPALELNGFTSHQLRLIQLVIKKYFKNLIYIRLNGENASERKLVVYADSDDDKHLIMKEVKATKRNEAQMKVKAAVGFRHVIDLISSEKKLLVGHNCFLDVAHIHSKFLGPLPSTIEEYASSIHKHFPFIVDTKYILNTDNVVQLKMKKNSTSLSKAFAFLCGQSPFLPRSSSVINTPCVKFEVHVDEKSSSNWSCGAKHEAGYDAFMTGCVFAQVCNQVGIDFELYTPSKGLVYNERLKRYINLLYVSWKNGSVIDLSSGKETPESSIHQSFKRYPKVIFQNIVVLWGFSSDLKPATLNECLSKLFGLGNVTSIYYLDRTAAFIQFSKKDLVSDFLALKETLENNSNNAVSVLHPLQKILKGGNTQAADYEVYKEICSSSISKVLFADQANAVNIKRKNNEKRFSEAESLVIGAEDSKSEVPFIACSL